MTKNQSLEEKVQKFSGQVSSFKTAAIAGCYVAMNLVSQLTIGKQLHEYLALPSQQPSAVIDTLRTSGIMLFTSYANNIQNYMHQFINLFK